MSDLCGKVLGPYQILLRLKASPISEVYKAYDSSLGRYVVLEVILPSYPRPAGLLAKLQEHASALARLSHPGIAPLLECKEYEGVICLAFDCTPRRIFRRRFNQKLGWAEAARRLVSVANGLAHAHQHGIVDGNLRPARLILDQDGVAMLFDLGVEEIAAREIMAQLPGNWLGNDLSSYLAPEKVLGKPYDGRADIYSLGMIYYELMGGKLALQSETPFQQFFQQLTNPSFKLKKTAPYLPKPVRQMLEKALMQDPDQRFESMQHFAQLLARVALGQEVSARMVRDPRYQPKKAITQRNPLRMRRLVAPLFACVAIVIVASSLLLYYPPLPIASWLASPTSPRTLAVAANPTRAPTFTRTVTPAPTATITSTAPAAPAASPTSTITPLPSYTPTPTQVIDLPVQLETPLPYSARLINTDEDAKSMVSLARWGIGQLIDVAWSPDGSLYAVATTTGIYLLNPETFAIQRFLEIYPLTCLAFSPDGRQIASGDADGMIHLWDLATGEVLPALTGPRAAINELAFSPKSGKRLASASESGAVRIWETDNWSLVRERRSSVAVKSVAFSPDENFLAFGGYDGIVHIWDVESDRLDRDFTLNLTIHSLAFDAQGKILLMAGENSSVVQRIDLQTGAQMKALRGLPTKISQMRVSGNGRYVAASDYSGNVIVWAMEGTQVLGKKNERLPRNMGQGFVYTHHLAFSPDSKEISSAIWDGTVRFWNLESGEPTHMNAVQASTQLAIFAQALAISPDSKVLAVQTKDDHIRLFQIETGHSITGEIEGKLVPGHIFSSDSQYLAVIKKSSIISLVHVATGLEWTSFDIDFELYSVSFSKDGNYLASGDYSRLKIWKLPQMEQVFQGYELNTVGQRCRVRDWKLNSAYVTKNNYVDFKDWGLFEQCFIRKWPGWMSEWDFLEEPASMVGGGKGKLEVWGLRSGVPSASLNVELNDQVLDVAISPDGSLVAAILSDRAIHLWSMRAEKPNIEELFRLEDPQRKMSALTFSPDRRFLITASIDGVLLVWGVYP